MCLRVGVGGSLVRLERLEDLWCDFGEYFATMKKNRSAGDVRALLSSYYGVTDDKEKDEEDYSIDGKAFDSEAYSKVNSGDDMA